MGTCPRFKRTSLAWRRRPRKPPDPCWAGLFGRANQTAQTLQSMAAGPQHDAALDAAVREITPLFKQCTRCGKWVCEPICWNKKAGLCENCAPDLDEEIAAAQASAAREQVIEKLRQVDYLGQRDLAQVAPAPPQVRRQDAGRQILSRLRRADQREEEVCQLWSRG